MLLFLMLLRIPLFPRDSIVCKPLVALYNIAELFFFSLGRAARQDHQLYKEEEYLVYQGKISSIFLQHDASKSLEKILFEE